MTSMRKRVASRAWRAKILNNAALTKNHQRKLVDWFNYYLHPDHSIFQIPPTVVGGLFISGLTLRWELKIHQLPLVGFTNS